MPHDKQWFGFCNDKKVGASCTDIQGEAGGKLDVSTQNITFGSCPFNAAMRRRGFEKWSKVVLAGLLVLWLWF